MPVITTLTVLFFTNFSAMAQQNGEPLDVQLGEKLFKDDRFSQSFFSQHQGDFNKPLTQGDPILDMLKTPEGMFEHPLKGQQVSCASCHMVDQARSERFPWLVFTYNDFETKTLIPERNDGKKRTLRNSMNMVLSNLQPGRPLHWDGEFFSGEALTCASLVGRNMGWLLTEQKQADQHIADVIRRDEGHYPLDSDLKGSYSENFALLGVEVDQLSSEELKGKVCESITAYMSSLDFSRDEQGYYSGSAYDQFLKANGLRRGLKPKETSQQYLQYLRDQLNYKTDWKFVDRSPLEFHNHSAQFEEVELKGMKIFFTRGQCVSCHTPPDFTDYNFHNVGVSQIEYDQIHGGGAFAQLIMPSWKERDQLREKYFTATSEHPQWQGLFAKASKKESLEAADLGVWNVLGHPDKPSIQEELKSNLCESARLPSCENWTPNDYLNYSRAAFKTMPLRSLGQTAPYFHNGIAKNIDDVLRVYFAASHMARQGRLVNPDPILKAMHMMPHDFEALKAFLEALDEDYE